MCESNSFLRVANNDVISSFLELASRNSAVSPQLQRSAAFLSSQPSVPYSDIRAIWVAYPPSTRPPLLCLFSRCTFLFTSPKPREKSEELKARLLKLAELEERRVYKNLVKDIAHRKTVNQPFSSYKDQLGYGLHVVLTMFTGYVVGYVSFRALFGKVPVMNVTGGVIGLVCGMLLETCLFIIKSSSSTHDKWE